MIIWADVLAVLPSASGVSDTAQDLLLQWANAILDPSMLDGASGPTTKLARVYLCAHAAASLPTSAGGSSGIAGTVTSETVGSISRTYLASADGQSWLMQTTFGRAYLNIISSSFGRLPLVMA